MPIEVNVSGVVADLHNMAKRSTRAVRAQLKKEATALKNMSKRMAPVDEHNLESAHQVVKFVDTNDRVGYGVEVGGVVNGVNVDNYALIVHEGLDGKKYGQTPAGRAKASRERVRVGPKFLERALRKMEREGMMRRMREAVKRS